MKSKKYEAHPYEFPVEHINWTAGVGQPAGLYWLGGRIVMAPHESPAEEALLLAGALPVATLRFDADPVETVHRTGSVDRVSAAAAAGTFLYSAVN
ncbi:hypothetical protein BH23GEM9_BH23GEM9_06690 [soil metagenome]